MTERARVSRRKLLKAGAAAAAGGAAAMVGATANAGGQAAQIPGPRQTDVAGRKFKAYVRAGAQPASVEELTLLPIGPRDVLLRSEAACSCYSITPFALSTRVFRQPMIMNHSGMGIVEAVGQQVRRVQPGDRVIVAGTPQCGQCYQCLQGRPDHCQFLALAPRATATMPDGTPAFPMAGLGGTAELATVPEEYCVPVFTTVPAPELAMLADTTGTGLAATMNLIQMFPGSDVAVLGLGPLGLSVVQGARISGAAQIIGIDPIRARRDLATTLGATVVLDPNAEGAGLVEHVRELCGGPSDRRDAGGRAGTGRGPDFVFEAAGGDSFPPKAEPSPDPNGILPINQAFDLARTGGHIVLHGIAQRGQVSFAPSRLTIGGRTIHAGQQGGLHIMRDLPRYVRLIERGLFDAASLVTSTYPIERSTESFQAVADRTTIGSVVVF
jgi:S-(hydroxymethyl)glutathione dehydrogenase/alcohol dehydrogenase